MDDERREPRHGVEIQGRYRTGSGVARDVVITDISTRGCGFVDRFCNLSPGAFLTIRIGSIGPLVAEVKWIERFKVGVEFESALHPSVLDHMRTTIDGWSPIQAQPDNRHARDEALAGSSDADEPPRMALRVRAATIDDVREVFARSRLSLPIDGYDELVEMFHRLLEIVAIEEGQEGN